MPTTAPLESFRPFSLIHAAVIVALAGVVVIITILHRRWRGTRRADRLDLVLAGLALAGWVLVNGWWLLPRNFDLKASLPLHVCDLAGLVVPIALVARWRWSRAMLYYWGLGLSSQGFFTPDLQDGPARVGFWVFWFNHFSVVGIAIYDLTARGYRPAWTDWMIGASSALAYVAIMLPLNVWLGVNYGYVGPSAPGQPSLIDVLGPWPERVFVILGIGIIVTIAMTLPWTLTRRARRGSGRADDAKIAKAQR